MTGMEHAIERAIEVLDAVDRNHDLDSGDLASSEEYARALHEAGLLAPAPLREEWGIRWDDGVWECYRNRAEAEFGAGDEGTPVHRYVSDWLPVDRAEGDGSTDQ